MIFVAIVLVIVAIVVNYKVARKFERIAFQKGYDTSMHCFAMCFFLGIVGYLYVIALPNLRSNISVDNIDSKKDSNQSLAKKDETHKEKYDRLVTKAERYKDTFFERNFRISVYKSIIREMEELASINFEDSVEKLAEYKTHLELLKSKKIK